ncbi:hypothetical protein [Paracoccus sp. ME4]|uniref:hypothetical protein n=1 Tax=Paracoccus sp. ME4 TaxID=3138066 RepID=UPI00398A9E2D
MSDHARLEAALDEIERLKSQLQYMRDDIRDMAQWIETLAGQDLGLLSTIRRAHPELIQDSVFQQLHDDIDVNNRALRSASIGQWHDE